MGIPCGFFIKTHSLVGKKKAHSQLLGAVAVGSYADLFLSYGNTCCLSISEVDSSILGSIRKGYLLLQWLISISVKLLSSVTVAPVLLCSGSYTSIVILVSRVPLRTDYVSILHFLYQPLFYQGSLSLLRDQ